MHFPVEGHTTLDRTTPKILLYSHDTFGLGNIRRTLLLTQELTEQYPGAAILIVTGSPMIHAFRIPEGVDYIKLPCLDRISADHYEPRFLLDSATEVDRTRRAILETTVLNFDPDLMIVDKRPCGVDGELLDTLRALRRERRATKLVLGVRDILDEPQSTRLSLLRHRSFEVIDRYYDEVWIYGAQAVFDAVKEYGFPQCVADKTHFCGYLKRPVATAPRKSKALPHVLVTTGGGGDGSRMIETYLDGLKNLAGSFQAPALRSTIVFGPQIEDSRRALLLEKFSDLAHVTFLDFVPELTHLYAEADVVVSMAGYNTVCELLSFNRCAVLVPRAEPVREQLIRARLLAAQGYFEIVEPEELKPDFLMAKVLSSLARKPLARAAIDLGGLSRIRERVQALFEERVA